MAIRRRAAVLVGASVLAAGTLATFSTAASLADNGVVAPVVNADGGVYWRSQPDWNTPIQVAQHGVYTGDQVGLNCYTWGGTVPPYYDNSLWYQATVVSGFGLGSGLVNDHFIDSGANVPNQPMEGVPQCSDSTATAPSGPQSVFYSPNSTPDAVSGLTLADLNLPKGEWVVGGCSASEGANIPNGISTLAGWSLGRLGPIYFLDTASSQQISEVHTIILFDPGNTTDFAGGNSCDKDYDINSLLANWLQLDSANRLLIFAGAVTEELVPAKPGQSFIQSLVAGQLRKETETFAGLWKYYLAAIWNQPFAGQTLICDYPDMSHQDVLTNFASAVQNPPSSCPSAPDGQQPVAWNP